MDIKSDTLQVLPVTHSPDGKPLEPEERPAQRVLGVAVAPTGHIVPGQPVTIGVPTTINIEGTAGEFAQGFRHQCQSCIHFSPAAWQTLRAKWENSPDLIERKFVNGIRGMLLSSGNAQLAERHMGQDEELDVEHALQAMGLCRALTEIFSDHYRQFAPQIIHPLGGCPAQPGPSGEDLTQLFTPKNRQAARAGAQAYDAVLHAAVKRAKREP